MFDEVGVDMCVDVSVCFCGERGQGGVHKGMGIYIHIYTYIHVDICV